MHTFSIAHYTFANPWILAPMAGVSEMPFRTLALQAGAAAAPTELVSANGLLYGQARTARYLTHDSTVEKPFWVQIFGGDAESMAAGAERAAALGAAIIDINMGCPVRKVTKNGAGSALLCDIERACAIVEAIGKRTGLPVTVKIRAGWDHSQLNFVAMGQALQAAGCKAIALHARTRAQGYSGQANWQWIAELAAAVTIPVFGNGDVRTPQDGYRMLAETDCAGVMIGRAALGRPWLFTALAKGLPNELALTGAQRWQTIEEHWRRHLAFVGEPLTALKRFRPHLMWYAHGMVGAGQFRQSVVQLDSVPAMLEEAYGFFCGQPLQQLTATADEPMPLDMRTALG